MDVPLTRRTVPDRLRYLARRLDNEPCNAITVLAVVMSLHVLADELESSEGSHIPDVT
jgi:hypothetical protein